ncbi:MAG: hypothetical protein LIO96_11760 [Lachnospiraceae bacterium]|nr:hypothetical protein [Lachnospiraceae bacterium]
MATTLRPELKPNNKYWIEKHRYYELKHFCLQYPTWKKKYDYLAHDLGLVSPSGCIKSELIADGIIDRTSEKAVELAHIANKISLLRVVTLKTDRELGSYILKGVSRGVSYDALNTEEALPCSKDTYYDLYRKFFWLLDKERD